MQLQNRKSKLVVLALMLASALGSNAAMAVDFDTSGALTSIGTVATGVGAIAAAVFGVVIIVKGWKLLRGAA